LERRPGPLVEPILLAFGRPVKPRVYSPSHRITPAPHVRARLDESALRVVNNYRRRGGRGEVFVHVDLVATLFHLLDRLFAEAFLEAQTGGVEFMIGERADEVRGLEARGLDRLLRVHSKLDDVEQDLSEGLILIVAAGGRERGEGLAVFQDQRRRERNARAFSRLQFVGMAWCEQEALHARRDRDAGIARDEAREPRAARRGRKDVAGGVDHVDAGGVARALGFPYF